jgi:acetylglutamate kinase
LLNVNADTLAGHLAAAVGARRLIVAGATKGVLDGEGQTIAHLTPDEIDRMTASGAAHSGMIAKLAACRYALDGGVTDISIVSGRGVADFDAVEGTRIGLVASTSGRLS